MTDEQASPARAAGSATWRLLGYLRPYRRQVAIAYVAMPLSTGLNLIVPTVIAWAIDFGLDQGDASYLFLAGGIIMAIALVRGFLGFGQRYYGEWLTHRVAYDLRNEFYNAVQYQPFAFHDQSHTGDLMSRATGDIAEAERFVGIGLMDLVATLLLLVGVIAAMLLQSVPLALLALIPLPILLITTLRFGLTIEPMFKSIQEQMGVLSTVMQESLTGIRVVKAFAREPHELDKFDRENNEWFARREGVIKKWGNNWPFMTFLITMSIFLLLLFGGPAALDGRITVGALFAMISYVLMLNAPVQRLGFLVNLAATAGASAQRILEIIDLPGEVVDRPDALALGTTRGEVAFEHVAFAYRDRLNVLADIDFQAKPGERIALIGPTGSGKSTITNLIPRFYDVSGGRVLVDGHDVRDLQLKSLRRHIGIVMQEPFLFSQTVAENIAYGRPEASRDDIIAAAQAAHAHEFILELSDGYETRVGERGVTLSGGQKQRIAIARALLADPRILILDDSTSSVDTETEHLIQEALVGLMKGRTTFVIAQRLLTLKHADCILVLSDGRIAERGDHETLLATNGLYRQIYDLQLKDQEEFVALQERMAVEAGEGRTMNVKLDPRNGHGPQETADAERQAREARISRLLRDDDELLGKAYDGRLVRRLGGYIVPYKPRVIIAIILMTVSTLLGVAGPAVIGFAIDQGIRAGSADLLRLWTIVFLVTSIGEWLTNRTRVHIMAYVGTRIVADVRSDLFRHLHRLTLNFYSNYSVGRLMSRLIGDVGVLLDFMTWSITGLFRSVFNLVGIVVAMLLLNWQLALVAFAVMPLMVLLTNYWRQRVRQAYRATRQRLSLINGNLNETISGIRVTKSFSREERNFQHFDDLNRSFFDANVEATRLAALFFPGVDFIGSLATALVIGVGGWLVLGDALTAGTLVAIVLYVERFFDPIRELAQRYNTFQSTMAASERLFELLDLEPDLVDAPDAQPLPRARGEVEFDHVSFAYREGEKPVLHDMVLHAQPGERIALVGETGAGKSTIIRLLARFYDVTGGALRIDGHDVRDVTSDSLRQQLGIVLQDTFLFTGTVADNIRYGRLDATDAEVVAAARAVGADDFIRRLPDGYDAEVGENGSNLSVGQRQLVSFARALLADPRILILDEATSSVDTATERVIQSALDTLMEGRTSFVIAHRLSTIIGADQIVVLDHGRIVEQGTHEELLARRGRYYNLYTMQFRKTV